MSARKTPPSKPTLTQISRDEDKHRKMDNVLQTSISDYYNRQRLSVCMHFRSSSRSDPISASHAIGGIRSSSEDNQSSDEDFFSNRVYRVQYKKRSDKKVKTHDDEEDDEAPPSPCLLPAVVVTPNERGEASI